MKLIFKSWHLSKKKSFWIETMVDLFSKILSGWHFMDLSIEAIYIGENLVTLCEKSSVHIMHFLPLMYLSSSSRITMPNRIVSDFMLSRFIALVSVWIGVLILQPFHSTVSFLNCSTVYPLWHLLHWGHSDWISPSWNLASCWVLLLYACSRNQCAWQSHLAIFSR